MRKMILIIVAGLYSFLMGSCSTMNSSQDLKAQSGSHVIDNLDGTFIDNRNLLQWAKDDLSPGPTACNVGTEKSLWYLSMYLDCLNKKKYLGYNNWRLPTYKELESLLTSPEIENNTIINPETREKLKNHAYWSTTDMAMFIYKRGIMIYNLTSPIYYYHQSARYYVWPVRSDDNVKYAASNGGSQVDQ